jgi:hypothetical protein
VITVKLLFDQKRSFKHEAKNFNRKTLMSHRTSHQKTKLKCSFFSSTSCGVSKRKFLIPFLTFFLVFLFAFYHDRVACHDHHNHDVDRCRGIVNVFVCRDLSIDFYRVLTFPVDLNLFPFCRVIGFDLSFDHPFRALLIFAFPSSTFHRSLILCPCGVSILSIGFDCDV